MIRATIFALCCTGQIAIYSPSVAQGVNDLERSAAVFLERIVRPWSLVLSVWSRDPTSDEWVSAKADCASEKKLDNTGATGGDGVSLPPESERYGSIAFFRGAGGLQSINLQTGEIEVFPDIRTGTSQSGAPAYQISNTKRGVKIAIGKAETNDSPAVVMVFDGGLYLSCRQPKDNQ